MSSNSEPESILVTTFRYAWRIDCNAKPKHCRDRIGGMLRAIAERIDGRASLAVVMATDPPLPTGTVHEIARKGVEHMARLLEESARAECSERLLRQMEPQLFEDRL